MITLNGFRLLNGFKIISALAIITIALSSTVSADINIDGQVIPAIDITSISILPASGDLNVITIPGYTVTKDGLPPPPGVVAITAFSASPATIDEGQSTTLSWTTSNANSCTASQGTGGWGGGVAVSGSANITIATAGTYTFTLTCDDVQANTDSRNVTVTVNTPAPPPGPDNCPIQPLTGTQATWMELWGIGFPKPGYATRNDIVPFSGYRAYEFYTGNIVDNGFVTEVGNTQTSGLRRGSISECPGDFNVAPECDQVWGIGGGIGWATDGKAGSCQLKANTTYYFNMTFTDGFDSKSSTCDSNPCVISVQHVNR